MLRQPWACSLGVWALLCLQATARELPASASGPSAALVINNWALSHPWLPSDFPNPRTDPTRCGRRDAPSWVCDPDGILAFEKANEIDAVISQILLADPPFGRASCVAGDQQAGYQVAVALMQRLQVDVGSSISQAAAAFASSLLNGWRLGSAECANGVVLLISVEDQQVVVLSGQDAAQRLTPRRARAVEEAALAVLMGGGGDAGDAVRDAVVRLGVALAKPPGYGLTRGMCDVLVWCALLFMAFMFFHPCRASWRRRHDVAACKRLLDRLKEEQHHALQYLQYPTASCPVCLEEFTPPSRLRASASRAALMTCSDTEGSVRGGCGFAAAPGTSPGGHGLGTTPPGAANGPFTNAAVGSFNGTANGSFGHGAAAGHGSGGVLMATASHSKKSSWGDALLGGGSGGGVSGGDGGGGSGGGRSLTRSVSRMTMRALSFSKVPRRLPLLLPCGHAFCEECIKTWVEQKNNCPICRMRLRPSEANEAKQAAEDEPPTPRPITQPEDIMDEVAFRIGSIHRRFPHIVDAEAASSLASQAQRGEVLSYGVRGVGGGGGVWHRVGSSASLASMAVGSITAAGGHGGYGGGHGGGGGAAGGPGGSGHGGYGGYGGANGAVGGPGGSGHGNALLAPLLGSTASLSSLMQHQPPGVGSFAVGGIGGSGGGSGHGSSHAGGSGHGGGGSGAISRSIIYASSSMQRSSSHARSLQGSGGGASAGSVLLGGGYGGDGGGGGGSVVGVKSDGSVHRGSSAGDVLRRINSQGGGLHRVASGGGGGGGSGTAGCGSGPGGSVHSTRSRSGSQRSGVAAGGGALAAAFLRLAGETSPLPQPPQQQQKQPGVLADGAAEGQHRGQQPMTGSVPWPWPSTPAPQQPPVTVAAASVGAPAPGLAAYPSYGVAAVSGAAQQQQLHGGYHFPQGCATEGLVEDSGGVRQHGAATAHVAVAGQPPPTPLPPQQPGNRAAPASWQAGGSVAVKSSQHPGGSAGGASGL